MGLVGDGLEKVAEDDYPFFLEDIPLFYDLERVSCVEEAVGRVEEDKVEGRFFFAELDDRPVELFVHDPAPVFRFASCQVELYYLNGGIEFLYKNRCFSAAAQRFYFDGPNPGEAVEDGRSPDFLLDGADVAEGLP